MPNLEVTQIPKLPILLSLLGQILPTGMIGQIVTVLLNPETPIGLKKLPKSRQFKITN